MLDLWFDPITTTHHKIMILIVLLAVIVVLYLRQPLPLYSILLFMANALLYVLCRYAKQRLSQRQAPILLQRLCTWVPIACLLSLIFMQQSSSLLALGVQGIAIFVACIAPLSVIYNWLFVAQRTSS